MHHASPGWLTVPTRLIYYISSQNSVYCKCDVGFPRYFGEQVSSYKSELEVFRFRGRHHQSAAYAKQSHPTSGQDCYAESQARQCPSKQHPGEASERVSNCHLDHGLSLGSVPPVSPQDGRGQEGVLTFRKK
jgi:hypothetical protein